MTRRLYSNLKFVGCQHWSSCGVCTIHFQFVGIISCVHECYMYMCRHTVHVCNDCVSIYKKECTVAAPSRKIICYGTCLFLILIPRMWRRHHSVYTYLVCYQTLFSLLQVTPTLPYLHCTYCMYTYMYLADNGATQI